MQPRLIPILGGLLLGVSILHAAPDKKEPEPAIRWTPPQWAVGQTFRVSVVTETRQFQSEDELGNGPREFYRVVESSPVIWNLVVAKEQFLKGFPAKKIWIRGSQEGAKAPTLEMAFIARVKDNQVVELALERAVDRTAGGEGTLNMRKLAVRPSPGIMTGTLFPVAFPRVASEIRTQARYHLTHVEAEGFAFARDIIQTLKVGDDAKKAFEKAGLMLKDRTGVAVDLYRPSDHVRAEILWLDGDPWPSDVRVGLQRATVIP